MEGKELKKRIGCEVVNKVKYLGIFVLKNTELFKNNYEKVMENVTRDLQICNKLKLSLLG